MFTTFVLFGDHLLWIKTSDKNTRIDAVVILAGSSTEDPRRVQSAIELFHRKNAKYLILPMRHPAFTWSWVVKTYNPVFAPPEKKILIGRSGKSVQTALERYGGTFVEAQNTAQLMVDYKLKAAVVVSSGYHMRRAALAFDRTGKAAGVTYTYHPVGDRKWGWWLHKNRIRKIVREYKKLIAALFLYPSGEELIRGKMSQNPLPTK